MNWIPILHLHPTNTDFDTLKHHKKFKSINVEGPILQTPIEYPRELVLRTKEHLNNKKAKFENPRKPQQEKIFKGTCVS